MNKIKIKRLRSRLYKIKKQNKELQQALHANEQVFKTDNKTSSRLGKNRLWNVFSVIKGLYQEVLFFH